MRTNSVGICGQSDAREMYCRFIPIVDLLFYVSVAQSAAQVIELTQVPCQLLESEQGVNRGFKSARLHDCESTNATKVDRRLAHAPALKLKPGKTIFRVSNKNVPYELDYWLRGATFAGRAILPSVFGGGLTTGKTQDYEVDFKHGEYVYYCPLNSTPDYQHIVE